MRMNEKERTIKENWEQIKQSIQSEYGISDTAYKTWISPLSFHSLVEDVITIIIPSDVAHLLNYISKKYGIYFQVTISEMLNGSFEENETYRVHFVLEKEIEKAPDVSEEKEQPLKNDYNPNYEIANLNPKYKFETFVVGNNNRFAHSAALAVAESPGEVYNPLFIYGGAGLGKTHLIHSIGRYIIDNYPQKKVIYVTSEDFMNELISSIRSNNNSVMNKFREKYRNVDVLMIDDIQFIIGRESTQEEFFHTFNVLHAAGKQIVLSSDKPPKDMDILEERIRSRFEWGLIADVQPPDYETRMAILQKNAENNHKEIDNEVFDYIASNIKSNIRELEGAYNKIIFFSRLNNLDITLPMAKEALKDMIYPNEEDAITPDRIMQVVSEHYGVSIDDICSKKRNAEIVLPRQVFVYLCRELINTSLVTVGKMIQRDHTTVMHSVEKVENMLKTDTGFANTVEIIRKKIVP